MALNPSIILSGQQVQPVNALMQGAQAGQQMNDIKHANDMRDMYQQHGAGIAAGDQNALNALAAFDPQAALGVQGTRLGMDQTRQNMAATQQRMAMLSREEQRAIDAQASQMTAQQRAAEAQQIEQAVASGLQAQTPQQWDQMVSSIAPDLVGQFENREMIAGRYMSIADSLQRFDERNVAPEAPKPSSSIGKLQSDLASGIINQQQYDLALQNMAPSGMSIRSDGNGGFSLDQGAGVGAPDLNVDQAKNTGFHIRATDANDVINGLESQGTDFWQQAAGAVPFGVGNYARTPEYQQYDQAKRDMINAILRRESGAVIADSEFANAEQQYFPVPGDSDEVIAQKRQNRENAIRGMAIGSGGGAEFAAQQETAQAPSAEPVVIDGYTITVVE